MEGKYGEFQYRVVVVVAVVVSKNSYLRAQPSPGSDAGADVPTYVRMTRGVRERGVLVLCFLHFSSQTLPHFTQMTDDETSRREKTNAMSFSNVKPETLGISSDIETARIREHSTEHEK